jgi:hypothetical protein
MMRPLLLAWMPKNWLPDWLWLAHPHRAVS